MPFCLEAAHMFLIHSSLEIRPSWSESSLGAQSFCHEAAHMFLIHSSFEIRPSWSESSLGAQSFCHEAAHMHMGLWDSKLNKSSTNLRGCTMSNWLQSYLRYTLSLSSHLDIQVSRRQTGDCTYRYSFHKFQNNPCHRYQLHMLKWSEIFHSICLFIIWPSYYSVK